MTRNRRSSIPPAATGSSLARSVISAAIPLLLILGACTPAPKYRVRSQEPEPLERAVNRSQDSIPALEIRLLAPVKDFAASRITSPFGRRSSPGARGSRTHEGIDIKAQSGEEILAAAPGSVVFAGRKRGYGNVVIVDHGGGISTLYAHLFYATVRRGEAVGEGETVGRAGKRGSATGTHLHFELRRNGAAIDPAPHLWLDSGRR
jgi:murein DD-endopeptidase MepM/ murein hydrolase activator NlpD